MIGLPSLWRTHFLRAEMGLAIVATVCFILWSERFGGREHLNNLLDGNRAALYGTLSSVLATFAGFAVAAVSIVAALAGSPRLSGLRRSKHFTTLHDVFFSAVRVLGAGTILAFAGLMFDRESNHEFWIFYFAAGSVILGVLRLWRCVWTLELLVRNESTDRSRSEPTTGLGDISPFRRDP